VIDVGRRSLLQRWLDPGNEVAAEPRMAFVDDPTELRASGVLREPGAPGRGQVVSKPPGMGNPLARQRR
jgi:hypothetical protein